MLSSLRTRSKFREETLQNMATGFDINKLLLLTPYFGGFLLGIWILFLVKIACYWDQPVFDFDMFKFHQKLVYPNSMLSSLRTRSRCQEETLQNMASEEEACLYQIPLPYFGGFLLGIWILFLVKIACY